MEHTADIITRAFTLSRRHSAGIAIGVFSLVGLLLAAPASATIEQVATFGSSSQGLAVNTTGSGGAPAGTVYVNRSTYNAKGEFLSELGGVFPPFGIVSAVNQANGNLYALVGGTKTGKHIDPNEINIKAYNANGTVLISSFGELAEFGESIEESPGKFHTSLSPSAIAVDNSGVVYVADVQPNTGKGYGSRVMIFEPESPGDYEHYVYTGRANDIVESINGVGYVAASIALDDAGNLYTANGGGNIYEFDLDEPDAPVCEFELAAGGITAMTVNPQSGEVFFYSSKNKKIHQLSTCNSQGEFEEIAEFAVTPKPAEAVSGLAFNPSLAYEASRPPGILYGVQKFGSNGYIFAPAKQGISPVVEAESLAAVTSTTATIVAQINPKGSQTRYAFQYITRAAYEANEPTERFAGAKESPLGGAVLGSGQEALSGSAALSGLQPDTEYRYRAIATNHCEPEDEAEVCEGTGPAQAFRTFPALSPGLPDHRAYELVSPPQKSGGEVFPAAPEVASCVECKPGNLAQLFPMQSSPDGKGVVYEGQPFSTTEGATIYNEYLSKRTPSGWQTTILAPRLMGGEQQGYKAFDVGLAQGVLYQQGAPLLAPDAPADYSNLYLQPSGAPGALAPLLISPPPNRVSGDGTGSLRLAFAGASADFSRLFFAANDALTVETPFAPEALDGGFAKNSLYEWAEGQLRLVNVLPGNVATQPGAHFGAAPVNTQNNDDVSELAHAISEDGSRVFWSGEAGQVYVRVNGEATIEVPDPAKFLAATADGSRVLLRDGQMYDLETESITDLTEGQGGFQGITGQSEDLSHVYFVDTAVLTGEEENEYGAKAQAGEYNLYSWQEGSLSFLATLDPGDKLIRRGGDWVSTSSERTAEASPNGRWLAFLSQAPLSGYDNSGPCGGGGALGLCSEVFLFDAQTGQLRCASCDPSNQRSLGQSTLLSILSSPGREDPLPQPRYLLDSGRLYFDTQNALTPFDTNHGVEDTYQYEPDGVGTCEREEGCIDLISSGHGSTDSNFLAVDATGKSVFFTSRDQLMLKDRDELIDLYVAREGGGIASETETARGECQGEACQATVVAPNDPTPGSSSFEGAGNVVEKKQAKKHRKKRKHAKKAHHRRAKHNRGGVR